MSVKVWVKCSGMTDDEALGIQVLSDGTALDVVEACKGVFRWPKLSPAALCTEGGEIVPPSSAAASLTNLTLQIVQFPPLASVLKRNASHRPLSTGHRKDQVPTTSTPSILCFQNVTIPRRGKRRMNPNAEKREAVGTPTRIARLWDSLPVAELAFVSGSDPCPAQALCAWSCRSKLSFEAPREGISAGNGEESTYCCASSTIDGTKVQHVSENVTLPPDCGRQVPLRSCRLPYVRVGVREEPTPSFRSTATDALTVFEQAIPEVLSPVEGPSKVMPLLGPPVGAGGGGAPCACNKDIKVAKVEADMGNQVAECGLTTTFPVPCMDHISGWCCVI